MADEYIRREDAKIGLSKTFGRLNADIANYVIDKVEPADVVSVSAYKQVMLERDTAVEQLKQIGKDIREVIDDVVHLQRLLSADVVQVVRCRDCKYVRKYRSEESAKKFGQVYECVRYTIHCPNPDDFCSYGKRRGE